MLEMDDKTKKEKSKLLAREVAKMDECKNCQSRSFKEIMRPECLTYHRLIIGTERGGRIKPGA